MASFDPSRVNIADFVRASQPLFLPCPGYLVRLGTGFAASMVGDRMVGPWKPSPFRHDSTKHAWVELDAALCTYKSVMRETSHGSTDHFSGSLGISIGNPFLSGSVSGSYDKLMSENLEGVHASRIATHRIGRVNFPTSIEFTQEAKTLLHKDLAEFKKVYGEYFVSGYVVGADRGMSMHFSSKSRLERESKSVTVTVKVLWWEASTTTTTTEEHVASDVDIAFSAYDTINHDFLEQSTKSQDRVNLIQHYAGVYRDRLVHTEADIENVSKSLFLQDQLALSTRSSDELYISGLVVELVLLPYSTLHQFVT